MPGWAFSGAAYARGSNPLTATPFSIAVWGMMTSVGAADTDTLLHISRLSVNNTYWTIKRASGASVISFVCNAATGTRTASTVNTLTSNVPFHVVAVATSATDRKIVLNGDLANAGTNTTSTTPTNINRISFGLKDDTDAGFSLDGSVYGAAMWNGALSDTHIVTLANGAWPESILSKNLHSFWPNFRDRGDGIIQDWCGRNPLTLNAGSLDTASVRRQGPRSIMVPSLKRTRILRVA